MKDKNIQKYSGELKKIGISHEILEHPELHTPPEVLGYLGLELSDGSSTLIMRADDEFIAVIRRDDCKLDLKKLKEILRVNSLRMANPDEFEELTGLPLGAARVYNPGIKTFIDKKVFEKEYVTGGTGSFTVTIKYKTEDLNKIPDSKVVDVAEIKELEKVFSNKIVFSGIQPSGNLHLGNYIGAVKHWVKDQNNGLNIFCIVDLHAITVPQEPRLLREKTFELAAILIASGINPEKSILFIQSHNPDHANLGWVFNCFVSMGQLQRMTQFKDKSEDKEFVSVGLFDYPALMAADILLYDTTEVPVGEDQKQHVELTRDIAERFNSKFGETFVLPKPVIPKTGGRIMSLVDPTKKMSKSDANQNATIYLLDDLELARKKIMSATTDGFRRIAYDVKEQPGISNLLEIYSELQGNSIKEIEQKFENKNYKEFKVAVADVVVNFLKDFQAKYNKVIETDLKKVLEDGAQKAYKLSHPKLMEAYKKIGFVN